MLTNSMHLQWHTALLSVLMTYTKVQIFTTNLCRCMRRAAKYLYDINKKNQTKPANVKLETKKKHVYVRPNHILINFKPYKLQVK